MTKKNRCLEAFEKKEGKKDFRGESSSESRRDCFSCRVP